MVWKGQFKGRIKVLLPLIIIDIVNEHKQV